MQAMDLFPVTTRQALKFTTVEIAPYSMSVRDGPLTRILTMETQLSREALRICTCGEELKTRDLHFMMAFLGPVMSILGDAPGNNRRAVWVIHRVSKEAFVPSSKRPLDALTAVESLETPLPCITENSYLLTCFNGDIVDRDSHRMNMSRTNTMLHKYEGASELTLTRANDGWLTLQERTYVPGAELVRSTALNMGLKCRCRTKGVRLAGCAKRHSFGPFVTEIDGTLMGASSADSDAGLKTLDLDVLRLPPVGDERMITLLESIFSGQETDMHTQVAAVASALDCVPKGSLSLSDGPVSKYRSAGAFVWNNLMADKLLFLGVEARLQPWAMLLPCIIAGMGRAGEGPEQETVAYALLDQIRRTVEARLILDQSAMDRALEGKERSSSTPQSPLVVSRKRVLDVGNPALLSKKRGSGDA